MKFFKKAVLILILLIALILNFEDFAFCEVKSNVSSLKVNPNLTAKELKRGPIILMFPIFPSGFNQDFIPQEIRKDPITPTVKIVFDRLKDKDYKIISYAEVKEKIYKAYTASGNELTEEMKAIKKRGKEPINIIQSLASPEKGSQFNASQYRKEYFEPICKYLKAKYLMRTVTEYSEPNKDFLELSVTFLLYDMETGEEAFKVISRATKPIVEPGNLIEEACKAGLSKLPGFTK